MKLPIREQIHTNISRIQGAGTGISYAAFITLFVMEILSCIHTKETIDFFPQMAITHKSLYRWWFFSFNFWGLIKFSSYALTKGKVYATCRQPACKLTNASILCKAILCTLQNKIPQALAFKNRPELCARRCSKDTYVSQSFLQSKNIYGHHGNYDYCLHGGYLDCG